MSDLLREYIDLHMRRMTEASSKSADLNLLSNQNLGYAAEWAVYEAIDGASTLFAAKGPNDSRLVSPWSSATKTGHTIFKQIYKMMIEAAKMSLAQSSTFQRMKPNASDSKKYPPPGGGTRPVDVVSDIADIHVKYNDAARLAGFQRSRKEKEEIVDPVTKKKLINMREIPSSRTAKIFDAGMTQFIEEIIEEAEKDPVFGGYVVGGLLRKPTSLSSKDKSKESLKQWAKFEKAKTAYQDAVQRIGRERLLDIFSGMGIEKAILADINDQLFGGSRKESSVQTVFAKFFSNEFTSEDDVANFDAAEYRSSIKCYFLDYKQMMRLSNPLKQLNVYTVPPTGFKREKAEIASAAMKVATGPTFRKKFNVAGLSTVFYLVTGKGENADNIYFKIEFRLDGEGHPPQLKVGPDLDQL